MSRGLRYNKNKVDMLKYIEDSLSEKDKGNLSHVFNLNTKSKSFKDKEEALEYIESWLDFSFLIEMSKVLEEGAKKYARDNWKKGLSMRDCINSEIRHAYKESTGIKYDEESGCRHEAHCAVNAMFRYHLDRIHNLRD